LRAGTLSVLEKAASSLGARSRHAPRVVGKRHTECAYYKGAPGGCTSMMLAVAAGSYRPATLPWAETLPRRGEPAQAA